ncbi:hypothetical protein [Mesorhizobium sp. Root157]|uniref:hypothetical protein n=1 Tax=Mesorhizobium sp. Root157 TaxID=1736477 RepID=UPI000A75AA79|nr:hypothetical protein [Mesorhizobium sp. Root157]
MVQPVSVERWAAIRALREGEPPTFPLLAVATDLHPATIREKASLENWKKQGFQSRIVRENWGAHAPVAVTTATRPVNDLPQDGQGHAVQLGDFVTRRLAEMVTEVETNGGQLNKAQIDALWSMVRTAERSETLAKERTTENGTTDDAELAARLEKLDDRIVELAEAHAERLVSGQHRDGMD